MVPQILQQLGSVQNPMMAMIKQAKTVIGNIQNPQMMINQLVQQNPVVSQVISQYGSVDGAINALCQQKGINPREFMDALR